MTTRRRFLTITAAALALPLAARATPVVWRGIALGARAELRLAHPDAPAIAARAAAEIARLEAIFSLYRSDSDLSRLNAAGTLAAPPFELLECLGMAGGVHAASGGRFDPTVQPLWAVHAEAAAQGGVPDAAALARARAVTGWGGVRLDPARIALPRGGALTLNGIAQGYVADRVAALLRAEGLDRVLIDTGELRALGGQPEGGAWPVRLAAGGAVGLLDRALATSAPLGTTFDQAGTLGHILDPRTGHPAAPVWRSISISAPSAALADALSTAGCLTEDRRTLDALLRPYPEARVEAAQLA